MPVTVSILKNVAYFIARCLLFPCSIAGPVSQRAVDHCAGQHSGAANGTVASQHEVTEFEFGFRVRVG